MSFDPRVQRYRVFWFTNGRPTPIVLNGVWADKDFVLTEEGDHLQIAYHPLGDGHYKAEVSAKVEDKWTPQTTAEYRRTKLPK